jgi:FkbM family methyltransferase
MRLPLWVATLVRRRFFEAMGSTKYSKPGYLGIEDDLVRLLPARGFFVEAGAVDGFFESNTYYLERILGWRGVLVEPIPTMFRRIRWNRPDAIAFNCALVSDAYGEPRISMNDAHAVSQVAAESAGISVSARTLTSLLEAAELPRVDLLSLDVEGFEIEVLKGLDFSRYAPRFLLLECLTEGDLTRITAFLGDRYRLTSQLNERDFLFEDRFESVGLPSTFGADQVSRSVVTE